MNRTLLYYPKIVIRNQQWLRQSILYWDQIGSIVPRHMERELEACYDIQILQREGLYRAFTPNQYVESNRKIADEFAALLRRHRVKRVTSYREDEFELSWIYKAKIYRRLARELIRDSYAFEKDSRLFMDKKAAILYMALLAKYMANDDKDSITTPSTDDPAFLRLVLPKTGVKNNIPGLNLTFHDILPTPIENVQITDILKFKQRRRDELLNFRQTLYSHKDAIQLAKEAEEIRDLNARFSERLEVEISNLCKAFKGDRIRFVLGTLGNIFALESPALFTALTTQAPESIKITFSIAGVVVAGALSIGKYYVDARNRENERLANNSFSYLYLAQQEGII